MSTYSHNNASQVEINSEFFPKGGYSINITTQEIVDLTEWSDRPVSIQNSGSSDLMFVVGVDAAQAIRPVGTYDLSDTDMVPVILAPKAVFRGIIPKSHPFLYIQAVSAASDVRIWRS